jgi:deoxyribodipyrimidine photo-lyase
MNVLVWLNQDLRAEDHPALAFAAARGPVLPLYVVDPDHWASPDRSARHWAFCSESLKDLAAALAALELPLAIRVGDPVPVMERLVRAHRITEIVTQQAGSAAEARVAEWARASGLRWTALPADTPAAPLTARGIDGVSTGALPLARALRLADDPCPHRQPGGRSAALAVLESFLTSRAAPGLPAQVTPAGAERASPRLSAHLAFGTLSASEVITAIDARLTDRPLPQMASGLRATQSRLLARATAMRSAEAFPRRSAESDAARLAAWGAGETGLPYLDACLRYLNATGWLPHAARSMVLGCALHHLSLDSRSAGEALARRLTDYTPSIHWAQVRRHAGLAEVPPRICNPVRLGQTLDPDGSFTRRWLPELAPVPDALLQEPWKWSGAPGLLGRRYPEPVVDPVSAARDARDRLTASRRACGTPPPRRLRPTLSALIEGSRSPQGGQLCFDL